MFDEDSNCRCNACLELIPDLLLWMEVHGTYKTYGSYKTFTWHFCDPHCLKKHMNELDMEKIGIAKHKNAKTLLRKVPK